VTWVRIDDGLADHPKFALLPVKARWLYIRGLCYSARYLTDGEIALTVAHTWEGKAAAEQLVDAGLWTRRGASYWVHDYLDWNPSRADVVARRSMDSARKRTGNPSGIQTESDRNPSGIRVDSSRAQDGTGLGRGLEVGGGGAGGGGDPPGFAEFWAAFPRKVGKPKARLKFAAALHRAEAATITAGAIRYRDDPNREDGFTAHPTTWLERDGWNDPPIPPRSNGKAASVRNLLAVADRMEDQGR
jgi:hypothetical protein